MVEGPEGTGLRPSQEHHVPEAQLPALPRVPVPPGKPPKLLDPRLLVTLIFLQYFLSQAGLC